MFPRNIVLSLASTFVLRNINPLFLSLVFVSSPLFAATVPAIPVEQNTFFKGKQLKTSSLPALPVALQGATATTIDGQIFVHGTDGSKGRALGYLFRLSKDQQSWMMLSDRFLPREHGAMLSYKNRLWILGGRTQKGPVPTVEIYDLATGSITFGKDLPTPRYFASAAVYGGYFFVAGGTMGWGRQATVEIYDPKNDQWFLGNPLKQARDTQLAVVDGQLLAFGGYTGKDVSRMIERLDPKTLTWHAYAEMPVETSAYSIVVMDQMVYTFGDFHQLDRILRFEPLKKEWRWLKSDFTPRRRAAAVGINGDVLLIGGKSDAYLDTVETLSVP